MAKTNGATEKTGLIKRKKDIVYSNTVPLESEKYQLTTEEYHAIGGQEEEMVKEVAAEREADTSLRSRRTSATTGRAELVN
eukprot:g47751.t1